MSWPRRMLLASAGVVTFLASWATSSLVLPFPRQCGITPCDTGAVNILGSGNYTWPQTLVMLVGIVAGVFSSVWRQRQRDLTSLRPLLYLSLASSWRSFYRTQWDWVGSFGHPPTDQRLGAGIALVGLITALAISIIGERRLQRSSAT